ncbi:MAG: hypothetical protein ACJAZ9_000687 [Neolewinella sp.]|jgi:hypothetical protein
MLSVVKVQVQKKVKETNPREPFFGKERLIDKL